MARVLALFVLIACLAIAFAAEETKDKAKDDLETAPGYHFGFHRGFHRGFYGYPGFGYGGYRHFGYGYPHFGYGYGHGFYG